jgi:ketosteroid isomerase-like protein
MAEQDAKRQFRAVVEELVGPEGDLGYMHESLPQLVEVLRAFATPDFECRMCPRPPTPALVYPGVDGVVAAWNDYGGAFERVGAKLTGIVESDTHGVLMVDQTGTTRHGGVEISQPSAMVFEFEGDGLRRVEFHLDQAEALRVAGVEP